MYSKDIKQKAQNNPNYKIIKELRILPHGRKVWILPDELVHNEIRERHGR